MTETPTITARNPCSIDSDHTEGSHDGIYDEAVYIGARCVALSMTILFETAEGNHLFNMPGGMLILVCCEGNYVGHSGLSFISLLSIM